MTCSHCGTNNFNWVRTCANCGHDVAGRADPSAPPPSPQETSTAAVGAAAEAGWGEPRRLRDYTSPPFVVPLLLLVNVGLFLMEAKSARSVMSIASEVLQLWGANYGPSVTAGEWWRLGAATFLHAGLSHLLLNMLALLFAGSLTERLFGRLPFFVIYALAGLGGSVAGVYWHPVVVSVGASGAIFGVYGALVAFLLLARRSFPTAERTSLRNSAVVFVALGLLLGATQPEVDVAAHVGGLFVGLVAGALLARPGASYSDGSRARLGALVGAAGVALLVLAASRLPVHDDWVGALRTLGELERRSWSGVTQAMQRVATRRMRGEAFADFVDQAVVAPWREYRAHVAALRLPPYESSLAALMVSYMDHRATGWRLHAEAVRREDLSLMEASNRAHSSANDEGIAFARALGVPPPTPAPAPPARLSR